MKCIYCRRIVNKILYFHFMMYILNNNAGDCTLLHVLSLCSSLFLLKFYIIS